MPIAKPEVLLAELGFPAATEKYTQARGRGDLFNRGGNCPAPGRRLVGTGRTRRSSAKDADLFAVPTRIVVHRQSWPFGPRVRTCRSVEASEIRSAE
jgi:hypothetical protein